MTETPGEKPIRRSGRRARRRRAVIISVIIAVALVGAILGTRPAYRALKHRRAERLAGEGEQLVRAGNLNEGARKYSAALQLDPVDYRALAGAARLATKGGRPEAPDLWAEVIRAPEASDADRSEYATFLLQTGRISIGERIVDELLKKNPEVPTLILASRYAQAAGDLPKAVQFVRIAAKQNANDNAVQFRLAELLVMLADVGSRAEARSILWALAGGESEYRLRALEGLAALAPELTVDEQQRVAAALEGAPTIRHALIAADLRIRLQPARADEIYGQVIGAWSNRGAGAAAELGGWLNAHLQGRRALEIAPIEAALGNEALMLVRLDSLANLGEWQAIDELLGRSDITFDAVVTETFKARAAQGAGKSLEAEAHWDRAIGLAGGDAARLQFVANFAAKSDASAAAGKALQQLARAPDQAAFALRNLQLNARRTGDTRAERTAAEKLARMRGDDPDAQSHAIYLNLLTETDVPANLAKARELVAAQPDRLAHRVAAGLGYLRMHDPATAAAQFIGPSGAPPIEWARTAPAWRAVYAAVLQANDDSADARALATQIPLKDLLPEERALIAPIIGAKAP